MNFAKFLRAPFFIEHLWWLLLKREVSDFTDIVSFEDEEKVQHYREESDLHQNFLLSKLLNVSKQPSYVPFTPTAETEKNTKMITKCSERKKYRLRCHSFITFAKFSEKLTFLTA